MRVALPIWFDVEFECSDESTFAQLTVAVELAAFHHLVFVTSSGAQAEEVTVHVEGLGHVQVKCLGADPD
jgi:hypothetical protein